MCLMIWISSIFYSLDQSFQENFLQWQKCSVIGTVHYGTTTGMWPLSTWNMASATEKLDFNLILINLNLS